MLTFIEENLCYKKILVAEKEKDQRRSHIALQIHNKHAGWEAQWRNRGLA